MRTAKTMRTRGAAALLALTLAACGPGAAAGPPPGVPAPDPGAAAAELVRATAPATAQQTTFSWELDEAGSRVRGRGVVRMQPPDRIRLDLFGPRGETYLAAALVGSEMRVPPALEERFSLPSPGLLWGVLGVVRPPEGARLASASTTDGGTVLRYELPDGSTLEYAATGERLTGVRRLERGAVRESIELTHDEAKAPRRALYRDWAAYRTLTLTREETTDVAAFPEATWTPPGTGR